MTDHSAIHSTFSLERSYEAAPARVFAAWAEPEAKAKWLTGGNAEHQLDFRAGGREIVRATNPQGDVMTYDAAYHDIVSGARIVYSSTLSVGDKVATVSITTVEIAPDGDGTRLVLTEQGTYLDGLEEPSWREEGTGQQLDALATVLKEGGDSDERTG